MAYEVGIGYHMPIGGYKPFMVIDRSNELGIDL
jgi:hypothetical protein